MKFKIMDYSGHSVLDFERDADGMTKAEERFRELTGEGFTAAVPIGNGEHRLVREFNKDEQEMLFIPQRVGG